jgi:hypothetical protein
MCVCVYMYVCIHECMYVLACLACVYFYILSGSVVVYV